MTEAELAIAAWRAWFWGEIEHWAFLLVVVFLAIEFAALKIGTPYKKILDDQKDLKIAELNNETSRLKIQLAPRSLTKEQFDAIQTLKGRAAAINLAVQADTECEIFAATLAAALMNAGITIRRYSLPPDMRGSGGLLIYDQHIFLDNSVGGVIFETLKNAQVAVVAKSSRLPDALVMPRDVPAILVYEKPSAPYISPPYFGSPPDQASPTPSK